MKQPLFQMALAILFLVGCEKNSTFIDYDKLKLEQSINADDTQIEENFSFTTSDSWAINIEDITTTSKSASDTSWVTVSPMNGDTGTSELRITMDVNYTGEARKTKINVKSGDHIITLVIEQKATMADGEIPKIVPKLISSVEIVVLSSNSSEAASALVQFDYNDNYQLIEMKMGDGADFSDRVAITYQDNKIIVKDYSTSDYFYDHAWEHILNDKGMVVSSKEILPSEDEEKADTYTLTYNSDGYLQKRNGYGGDMIFTWEDNNLIKFAEAVTDNQDYPLSSNHTYTSYENKTNLDLHFFLLSIEMVSFAYGREMIPIHVLIKKAGVSSANFIKEHKYTYIGGTGINTFEYKFDADEYPTEIIFKDKDASGTYTYTYTIKYDE